MKERYERITECENEVIEALAGLDCEAALEVERLSDVEAVHPLTWMSERSKMMVGLICYDNTDKIGSLEEVYVNGFQRQLSYAEENGVQ